MLNKILKKKTYALYQFISLLAIALIIGTLIAGIYNAITSDTDGNSWKIGAINVLSFNFAGSLGTAASSIFYIGVVILISSWVVAGFSVRADKRNMWDSLFLLFCFIPIIGNILCLIAQLVGEECEFKSAFVDRKKIKEEIRKHHIIFHKASESGKRAIEKTLTIKERFLPKVQALTNRLKSKDSFKSLKNKKEKDKDIAKK